MTIMYDSATPGAIPASAPVVAGYVDGEDAWLPADWARFAGRPEVGISVLGKPFQMAYDVEAGNPLTMDEAIDLARQSQAAGINGAVYSQASRPLPSGAGVPWWAADWTGEPHMVPGAAATQFASPVVPGGWVTANYDVSLTGSDWPLRAGPGPVIIPVVTKPAVVALIKNPAGPGYWIVAADGGVFTKGGAQFYGSLGGKTLSAPIVGASPSADGKGYGLVGADGAVYAFGSFPYDGGQNG